MSAVRIRIPQIMDLKAIPIAHGFLSSPSDPPLLLFSSPLSLFMSAEQEVNERKPLLERKGSSGSDWSLSDAETLAGDSGRSTPTLLSPTTDESWWPLIAIFAITAVQVCIHSSSRNGHSNSPTAVVLRAHLSLHQWALILSDLLDRMLMDPLDQMILENGIVNEPEKVGFYTGASRSFPGILCVPTLMGERLH